VGDTAKTTAPVAVVGQVARDLVLRVDDAPAAGDAVPVRQRRELLGGKGANHSVALAQLGVPVALVGVVGADEVGARLLAQAREDGVDVTHVVRRSGATTGLIVDVVDGHGDWRYLEDLPDEVLLTEADIAAAAPVLRAARGTVVQLQQPSGAALAAARCTKEAGGFVVLEGAPPDDERRGELLATADVLRADVKEARLLTGADLRDTADVARAATELLERHGLSLVAFGAPDGDVFVWPAGAVAFGHGDAEVVDTTGAGDALAAAMTSVLYRGGGPAEAAELAVAAAAATVEHAGGRPDLTRERLRHFRAKAGSRSADLSQGR
jgi:ribokinase